MKKLYIQNVLLIVFIIVIIYPLNTFSQSVAITDDDSYIPDESAMLDVKSTDKGMLVPRMTTEERLAIGLPGVPATGLMVYDTDFNNFFYYNGISWMSFPQIGSSGIGGPLFNVINSYGDTIFAVYDDGVQIIVPTGVKGKVGGFAVSGRSPSKGVTDDYMVITPDSARIYINDTVSAKGKVGGFAVSGRSPSKGTTNDIFFATADSTRIYVDETASKGKVGGFAVSGRSPSKATTNSFLNLSSKNYFIGHQSGSSITTGLYNTFFGYQSGLADSSGSNNVFIGYQAGSSNTSGHSNIFIGELAGTSNTTGPSSVFIGKSAGLSHTTGHENIFIGEWCGQKTTTGYSNLFMGRLTGYANTIGDNNVYLGKYAGFWNVAGSKNVFVGNDAGMNNQGSGNVFIGYNAGYNEEGSFRLYIDTSDTATPLIYGEFDNRNIVIDGGANDNPNGHKFAVTGVAGAEAWVNLTKKSEAKSVTEIIGSLDKIVQLQGISYTITDKKGSNVKQIAINPEIAVKVIPEIAEDYGSMYGIDYSKLTVLLIEAVKEQQLQINELQQLINVKEIEIQKSNVSDEQINLLIEENKKLKEDITIIKDLLKSNLDKE